MAIPRIRTLNFLPEVFKTNTNTQFLSATLDQLVSKPNLLKVEGYLGGSIGSGVNSKGKYVSESTKTRTDFQLEPGVVFKKTNNNVARDFISYPGIIDSLKLEGAVTEDNDKLFNSQYYSWDSFTDLDKLINFNQYYWLPEGPARVNVTTATVFNATSYSVTDSFNGYIITGDGDNRALTNPTLTLLRGGTYTFAVRQDTPFWIQGEPGLTGYSSTQTNVQTRDVLGVDNNGATVGFITFTVPTKDAASAYNFPGDNRVDVVSTRTYDQINGAPVRSLAGGIDGVTSLNGRTLMFYNTGQVNEQGFISAFYDTTTFDQIDPALVDGFGNYDGGYYTDVSATFYEITYEGDVNDPVIRLVEAGPIPTNQNITPDYGTLWINRPFYRNSVGTVLLVPYDSAILDTLYYQDGVSAIKTGTIKIIDSNATNKLDINERILGEKQYTAANGVVFTNGLLVTFSGEIFPSNYKTGAYYVEGVGTSIELVPSRELISPELFSAGSYIPYDTINYDIGNYDSNLYVPVTPDYMTIARNAQNRNAWARSNRWFHADVITATSQYNNDPSLLSKYLTFENKAKRPIIEFYANTRLFSAGIVAKPPVDFIDFRSTDAFSDVVGETAHYPDVVAYTQPDCTVVAITGPLVTTATATTALNNVIECGSTAGFHVNDRVTFNGAVFGGVQETTTVPPIVTVLYYVKDIIDSTHFTITDNINGDIVSLVGATGSMTVNVVQFSTTISVPAGSATGTFAVGHYITDTVHVLPRNTFITGVSGTTTLTLTVSWTNETTVAATTITSLVSTVNTVDNYSIFDGARIIFAADENPEVRNKVYVARFATLSTGAAPQLTLTVAVDGEVLPDNQTLVFRGYNNSGKTFYFDGTDWLLGQQKTNVNQPPLFDIFDTDGISFGDATNYTGTSFAGNTLFEYIVGTGPDDAVLSFPLKYSSLNNTGDISFNVSLNDATFSYMPYLAGAVPITQKVNTGFVYNHQSLTEYTRALGWQTAVTQSQQYQLFDFEYVADAQATSFVCDIAMSSTVNAVSNIKVYVGDVAQHSDAYTVSVSANTTTVTLASAPAIDMTVIVMLISDSVSKTAHYEIPVNLSNNPLNADITTVNVGDIRRHYTTIFNNAPDTRGTVFGKNNVRDLGNLVPYGSSIIQNSASLVLPATFLRKQNHNLFSAMLFNSREYATFKALLISTIDSTDFSVHQSPDFMLDDVLTQITAAKTNSNSFFWSDMLPLKAAFINNTYNFSNSMDVSVYPLSRIYDFSKANYQGVLVYLSRTTGGFTQVTQLISGVDYIVSQDSPSLSVLTNLNPGDSINVREYNQTYGSYVPNTPTKLGLYPATIPNVRLDSSYSNPTYFIQGHDGSYTRLYGDYDTVTERLIDFRDQVLLEFEKRIYNNLKISTPIPIVEAEVMPGFFRTTDYSQAEILEIYAANYLNWVGQNRIDYRRQVYNSNDEFTFNYSGTGNTLDSRLMGPGHWRGVYKYMFDTYTPDITPWEMLGFANMPTWWATRYGAAPYTSDNLVLWTDIARGISWNNGTPTVLPMYVRDGLLDVLPVDSSGDLVSPFDALVGNFSGASFIRDWKVGDIGPAELSYRRSSAWAFDLMRIFALTKPAKFFNLAVDMDNYKYSEEFNQYLVNGRSHLVIDNIELYGSGTAKTSYLNWIVDYEKQTGVDASDELNTLLDNIDVRLVYRLAGFSDKDLLKFYVEKGTPNTKSSSLLVPDESYSVLLYDNQPFTRLVYSSVIVQTTAAGYKVYGNSQTNAYFTVLRAKINGNYTKVSVENASVQLAKDYTQTELVIPYGAEFTSLQELSQFLAGYGAYLESRGAVFNKIDNGLEVNWQQMVAELLYWAQTGWEVGSLININPAAEQLVIDKDSHIVQPLTMRQQNFVLNQNMYPILSSDLAVVRDGTLFSVTPLNEGDTISYGTFNISNFEHGVVFDNVTVFDDIIYNLITGLRQSRIIVRGTKTADWDGTVNAPGFIMNQDNVPEWNVSTKYQKGSIVTYKNKYWTNLSVQEASATFDEKVWKHTEYDTIQQGLLPNPSTRSYESTLYYDANRTNLEKDGDVLGFSLIGYRPRDYLANADLTDITQVNVYKTLIKNKGTRNAANMFKGAELSQGKIDYDMFENWAIKTGEFGGVLSSNFVEFKLDAAQLTGNPTIVGLTNGTFTAGAQQEVPLYTLHNYGRAVSDPNVLPVLTGAQVPGIFPDAGYVHYNDVKMSSYFYSGLNAAVNVHDTPVPLSSLYVRDYLWIANFRNTWQVYTPVSLGRVGTVKSNFNDTLTVTFDKPHGLAKNDTMILVNFSPFVNSNYTVSSVTSLNSIVVAGNLPTGVTTMTGAGIGFRLQSQRVASARDILSLPLLNYEFNDYKVWVDTAASGDWAVYNKTINFSYAEEFNRALSLTYGSAVAHTAVMGYLVSDAAKGEVYRFTGNDNTGGYNEVQIITGDASFGTKIEHIDDIVLITCPLAATPYIRIYRMVRTSLVDELILEQTISAPVASISWADAVTISNDAQWIYVSCTELNTVYVYYKNVLNGDYVLVNTIDGDALGITTAGDNFGYSLATDHYSDTLIVSAPNKSDVSLSYTNAGRVFTFSRIDQNFEAPQNSLPFIPQLFDLAFDTTPYIVTTTASATAATTNRITVLSTASFVVGNAVVFSGTIISGSGLAANNVYYIKSIVNSTTFTISATRGGPDVVLFTAVGATTVTMQVAGLTVNNNGTLLTDDTYAIISDKLHTYGPIIAGDIINVDSFTFVLSQTISTPSVSRIGGQFGLSVDATAYASEILVGAPYEVNSLPELQEGVVYRYTNAGSKYGMMTATSVCSVTSPVSILLNGYYVHVPIGDATSTAAAINNARITNVQAISSGEKLTIYLIKTELSAANKKLALTVLDSATMAMLGMQVYSNTQVITDPHPSTRTQFGTVVKFNEFDSVVITAPVNTRYAAMTLDFETVHVEPDQGTIFDNNATQWVDLKTNAGAAYIFDYVEVHQENIMTPGVFVYAQSVNSMNEVYGAQPYYGQSVEFNAGVVVIGCPLFRPGFVNGQVVSYVNTSASGTSNWSVSRKSAPIVDSTRVKDIQLFSEATNETLDNLDHIDPLQGKLLGAVRQNIDVVSNTDPAGYNSGDQTNVGAIVWGSDKLGHIWFDTSNTRFLNYHQDDVVYNSTHWGKVFPGSTPAVYSWVSSSNTPSTYVGTGTPLDPTLFTVEYVATEAGALVPTYYFWVRNTNTVFTSMGKTLSDTILESYIADPSSSGIGYFAPVLPGVFALYNTNASINGKDTVLHIGFSNGENDDVIHNIFSLVRDGHSDDFLPGLPNSITTEPSSLYTRLLSSLSGCDLSGAVVPNPFLPKSVQYGVAARPNQSMFINRHAALKNYLTYANKVMASNPIAETRQPTYLYAAGETNPSTGGNSPVATKEFYDTTAYWKYVSWWADGYDSNILATVQVNKYADLLKVKATDAMVATVLFNGDGKSETYIFEAATGWVRIGLAAGTIEFSSNLWDYENTRTGFGDNFFDTVPFSEFPSEETRNIIRSLNEEIYTNELAVHRNKSLVLLFEYVQSETLAASNYLPWLNKTSLVDVSHSVRELLPIPVYQADNKDFLEGYLNEVKPYHVVIKDFLFKYTGAELYSGAITDFDLPVTYDSVTERFITPNLVYGTPGTDQYTPTNPIWQTAPYQSWFKNYGLSITGVDDYPISVLVSYMTLNTNEITVDNAFGFPSSGVVLIGDEKIAYSTVDRARSSISGLTRGIEGTPVTVHLPGESIITDLPPVLLLDSSRGYFEPPQVTAYIDTSIYPVPTRQAELVAVMAGDSILRIDVIDPGQGYAVLPEIVISPSVVVQFPSTLVNLATNTIVLLSPTLRTGDIVKYTSNTASTTLGGLANKQYYYVNVLSIAPAFVVALYMNYADALIDKDRVVIADAPAGGTHTFAVTARASCVSTAVPIRSNKMQMRFDRTTYRSKMIDWVSGAFYGSFFAGLLSNATHLASSSIKLRNTHPSIDSITVSTAGGVFEIDSVESVDTLTWSSRTRDVVSTASATNIITIAPSAGGAPLEGNVGPTTGFFVGMPVKFLGQTFGGLLTATTYYVESIISVTEFTIMDKNNLTITLSTDTESSVPLLCYPGKTESVAVVTLNYPGMLQATHTQAVTNNITVPLTTSGQLGTHEFYPGLPIFFTGTVFGGIVEHEQYFITTVIDNQTFTMSKVAEPVIINVTETRALDSGTGKTNVVVCDNITPLSVDDPVIFTEMSIGGADVLNFGGLEFGKTYYISEFLPGNTKFTVAVAPYSGIIVPLVDTTGKCVVTNQKDTVILTEATGSVTLNVGLPISPGQITGQNFEFYTTSRQYSGITGPITQLLQRPVFSTLATVNRISFGTSPDGLTDIYVNMPVTFITAVGGLSAATTYYVSEADTVATTVTGSFINNQFECLSTVGFYPDMPVSFSEQELGGITLGSEYYVRVVVDSTHFTVTTTPGGPEYVLWAQTGEMICTGAPYIKVAAAPGGIALALTTDTVPSTMVQATPSTPVFGISYILGGYRVITTSPGAGFARGNDITIPGTSLGGTDSNTLKITVDEVGLSVVASVTSSATNRVTCVSTFGFNVNDPIVFSNMVVSGTPELSFGGLVDGVVYFINSVVSETQITLSETISGPVLALTDAEGIMTLTNDNGAVSSVIATGKPNDANDKYYLKVISATACEVYSDPLLTIPVAGVDFNYIGIERTEVTATTSGTDVITCNDTTAFEVDDPVVFTGDVFSTLVLGTVYYINSIIDGTKFTVSATVGGSNFTLTTDVGSCLVAKSGDYALLPEPFYFDQSLVRYNNRVYQCLISNSDPEFIFGKWKLLRSDDRLLNALDRIFGYYQPTANMPGLDMTQLVDGITYPNGHYLGNAFAPDDEFEIDTMLHDAPFYPTELDIRAIVWSGSGYVAPTDSPSASYAVTSANGTSWTLIPTAKNALDVTDIVYSGSEYVVTTRNVATPILTSTDGVAWSVAGSYVPAAGPGFDLTPYELSTGSLTLNSIAYANGRFIAVGKNIITSTDAYAWSEVYQFYDNGLPNILHAVAAVSVANFTGFIAVGEAEFLSIPSDPFSTVTINVLLTSTTGQTWNSPANTLVNQALTAAGSDGTSIVVLGNNGAKFISSNGANWSDVSYGTSNITDVVYANGMFVAVGADGVIETSADGASWITAVSGTTEQLHSITWNNTLAEFITVGTNNTILRSADGITWTGDVVFATSESTYTVQGDEFLAGYGPEELVPGVVSDNLTMLVTTRPGTAWDSTEFAHVGYNTESVVLETEYTGQVEYHYGHIVPQPAQLSVFVVDGDTSANPGLSTRLYLDIDYTVEWLHDSVVLTTPLLVNDKLRVDVYEVGNGDQLVKSSTLSDPIRSNLVTGFDEIYLACNYSASIYTGSGVIRPDTDTVTAKAIKTESLGNSIECVSVFKFALNQAIAFHGEAFGGITIHTGITEAVTATTAVTNAITCTDTTGFVVGQQAIFTGTSFGNIVATDVYYIESIIDGTNFTISASEGGPVFALTTEVGTLSVGVGKMYFVKTISTATNKITISETRVGGIAGPTFALTDDTGLMDIIIRMGIGLVWTPPSVVHNGTTLVLGNINTISQTTGTNNTVKCDSTMGMYAGETIVFSNTMFGGIIVPLQEYYVKTIINDNEFTLSETLGGAVLVLTDAAGGAFSITNDFAFGISDNGITAKMVLAASYNHDDDYIVYSIFGETAPDQYGYTLPETETFVATAAQSVFALSYYVGDANPRNAIVELNGLRLSSGDYVISSVTRDLTLTVPAALNDIVAVTSFNLTDRQYLRTQFNVTGNTVATIAFISNDIRPALTTTLINTVVSATDVITCTSTAGFVIDQTIEFNTVGPGSFAGITFGTIYFVSSIISGTTFTISATLGGPTFNTTVDWTGLVQATVGAKPAVRVTTSVPHLYAEDDLIRIDGTTGSIQLNNGTFYIRRVSDVQVDLYNAPYDESLSADNDPVTVITAWQSGGYVWPASTFIISHAIATSTSGVTNLITCDTTQDLVLDTPIQFTGTAFGGINTDVVSGSFELGYSYVIMSLGTTDFTQIGAMRNAPGTIFIATGAGLGDGVAKQLYFIRDIPSPTTFSVSLELTAFSQLGLTTASGTMSVAQWNQRDTDRLWVTVNGYRVPSSVLKLNAGNEISILTAINPADEVIITSMMPTASPNAITYMQNVNKTGAASVYRVNSHTRTWLTAPLFLHDDVISVKDVTSLSHAVTQNEVAPAAVDGVITIGLIADKHLIRELSVYNVTTATEVSQSNLIVTILELSPILQIIGGVTAGDQLVITTIEGNVIYLNGEQITFASLDTATNTISGLRRGINGTGAQSVIPLYTEVFGVLSQNRLSDVLYNRTWQDTGPLQISHTTGANFIYHDA